MTKYIDADRLKAEIEALRERYGSYVAKNEVEQCYKGGRLIGYEDALNKINKLQQEQPEVDLDAIVNEAFDKYSSVDGYGQLSVSFNRAELYSFIKKIARKEGTK